MKIVIPGGSGQVGNILARHFHAKGDEVVVLSRSVDSKAPWRVVGWDGENLGPWQSEIDGADAVINLAGLSVNCRYHNANRKKMMDSRVKSTRVVGEAIAAATVPPPVWLQASTATIYAHRFDAPNDEANGIIGGTEPNVPAYWNFSIEIARNWEQVCNAAPTPHTRKVLLRSAMTMTPDAGGVFEILRALVNKGLGGSVGNGRQYVSWIHETDFIRAVEWLIEHNELDGPINLAAPNPLPYNDFMRAFRHACNMPIGLPATKCMLEIATFFMRTETELVLKSRRVIPTRLLESGFKFTYPEWEAAAKDLVQRARTKP